MGRIIIIQEQLFPLRRILAICHQIRIGRIGIPRIHVASNRDITTCSIKLQLSTVQSHGNITIEIDCTAIGRDDPICGQSLSRTMPEIRADSPFRDVTATARGKRPAIRRNIRIDDD